jgi:asparagine synthase (glutamine-hydrolysing)
MCGIVGFFNFDGEPANPVVLSRMLDLQRHRGPDDRGMRLFSLARGQSIEFAQGDAIHLKYFEGALGFNRLSILDLSERGHQPMCNDAQTVILGFNGEIYNAFSYKPELQAAGYNFRSRTDTEVILRLYEHFGLDGMLERLNGMFAIVIVDLRFRQVHLVRDNLGIKPLYWARQGNTLFFGSEVKSFRMHPNFVARLDEKNIDEYLSFRYCAADRFLIRDVHQLRPGHYLSFCASGSERIHRYYSIPDLPINRSTSRYELLNELEQRIRHSVRSQLISDVKVGCQLSGGIDSSLTTLFASSQQAANIDSFSVIFRDPKFSEDNWIAQASLAAHVDSHRFFFDEDTFFRTIEPATWHLDQPLNHPNSLGIYLLAEKSRRLVTVLLSGEGADELFGGYARFYYARVRSRMRPWLPLLCHLPRLGEKFSRNLGIEFRDPIEFFIGASMFQRPAELLQARPQANIGDVLEQRRSLFDEGCGDYLNNCLKYEMQTYMVDLLVRQDKMTMAHSVENRVPYLDRDLVSFVRTLPIDLLIGARLSLPVRNTKVILKDLARRSFGDRFVYRPKSGFSLPLLAYYQDKRFVMLMEDLLLPGMKTRGVVQSDAIRRWWTNIEKLPRILDETMWIAIAFELWAQQFLDASMPSSANHVLGRSLCSVGSGMPRT